MADPSPTEPPTGQEPDDGQGQEPDGTQATPKPDEPAQRSYPEAYVKQLRKEAAESRKKALELEERVEEFESRDKSELERLNERAATAERRATESEARLLRYEVAAERGLDMQAAAFLTGSTREEIELRAEELGKLLEASGQKPTASFDGGARPRVPEPTTPEEAHQELLREALSRRGR